MTNPERARAQDARAEDTAAESGGAEYQGTGDESHEGAGPTRADGNGAGAHGAGDHGADRGSTTIRERAVARIVAQAAAEIDESGGVGRSVLGVPVPGRRPARTEVRVNGDIVTASVAMSVTYPMPVREVARRVRESVRGRVEELTGFTVRQVDIDVSELGRPGNGERVVR